jgi:hypothetical protein
LIEDETYSKTHHIDETKSEMELIEEQADFELMKQRQYKHMQQRIQQDLVAMKISVNEHKESFEQKKQVLAEETEKKRKANQARLQAQHKLEQYMLFIDNDHLQR